MAMAATTTSMLPPHATMVATKTPVATTMAGARTTINNQLKAAAATAMAIAKKTETTMTMKTKAKVAAAVRLAW
jgi:hypothetical protein